MAKPANEKKSNRVCLKIVGPRLMIYSGETPSRDTRLHAVDLFALDWADRVRSYARDHGLEIVNPEMLAPGYFDHKH